MRRAFLSLALLAVAAPARAVDSAAASLVGAWRLVTYEDTPATGTKAYPYGREPKGQLIYDASGQMSIQIMKTPHPTIASGDEEKVTAAEKQALYDA